MLQIITYIYVKSQVRIKVLFYNIIIVRYKYMKEPEQKLIITKKLKGEDGHKVFSIRIKDETIERLDSIAKQTNRSRNDLINMLLDFAMDYCEIV